MDQQTQRQEIEHRPTTLWASGVFSDPPKLSDTGLFRVTCSCGGSIAEPTVKRAVMEMARHCEMTPTAVLTQVV